MDVRGMLNTMKKREKNQRTHELCSPFSFDGLREYPRPQMVRDSYENLNGAWDCTITDSNGNVKYQGKICVPFSPETALSGVGVVVEPGDLLVYTTAFTVGEEHCKRECENARGNDGAERLLLHFGAVDQIACVRLNDVEVGTHIGGYTPFTVDATTALCPGENRLTVEVRDTTDSSYHSRGKQKLSPEGMFYHCQSGIWQTVWMEWVPDTYMERLAITPDIDKDEVRIDVFLGGAADREEMPGQRGAFLEMKEDILDGWVMKEPAAVKKSAQPHASGQCDLSLTLRLKDYRLWTPESPVLYHCVISCGSDRVSTYFAMRKFSVEADGDGCKRLCLNHKPYFLWGVLDQGYWPESLMTPVSDEAMIFDIRSMKEVGFNMLRKHCKLEPLRWYYHCDRLGMVVWQDMVNGGSTYDMTKICQMPTMIPSWTRHRDTTTAAYTMTGRLDEEGRKQWRREYREMVETLYNVPSLGSWVMFNEGWGQFDAMENTEYARSLDDTRPIDASSGWFHQNCGDVYSVHNYFFKLRVDPAHLPFVISEYGGYSLQIKDHVYSDHIFGYRPYERQEELQQNFVRLQREIAALIPRGLSAAVYTQVTDVEEEINGIYTYDRRVQKLFPWK